MCPELKVATSIFPMARRHDLWPCTIQPSVHHMFSRSAPYAITECYFTVSVGPVQNSWTHTGIWTFTLMLPSSLVCFERGQDVEPLLWFPDPSLLIVQLSARACKRQMVTCLALRSCSTVFSAGTFKNMTGIKSSGRGPPSRPFFLLQCSARTE